MIKYYLLFWALPALTVLLILFQLYRIQSNLVPEDFDSDNWFNLLFLSVVYPLGLAFLVATVIWPWLIKER